MADPQLLQLLKEPELREQAKIFAKADPDLRASLETAAANGDSGAIVGVLTTALSQQLSNYDPNQYGATRVFTPEQEQRIADVAVPAGLAAVGAGAGGVGGRMFGEMVAPAGRFIPRLAGGTGAVIGDVGANAAYDLLRGRSPEEIGSNAIVNAIPSAGGEMLVGTARRALSPAARENVYGALNPGAVIDPFIKKGTAGNTIAQVEQLTAPRLAGQKSVEDVIVQSDFLNPKVTTFNPQTLRFEGQGTAPTLMLAAKEDQARQARASLLESRESYVRELDNSYKLLAAESPNGVKSVSLRDILSDSLLKDVREFGGGLVSPEGSSAKIASIRDLATRIAQLRGIEAPDDLIGSVVERYAKGEAVSNAPFTRIGLEKIPNEGLISTERLSMQGRGAGTTEQQLLNSVLDIKLTPSELTHLYTGLLDVNRSNKTYDASTLAKLMQRNPSGALADLREFDGALAKQLAPIVRDNISRIEGEVRALSGNPNLMGMPIDYLSEANATYAALSALEKELLPMLKGGASKGADSYGRALTGSIGKETVSSAAYDVGAKFIAGGDAQSTLIAQNDAFRAAYLLADMRQNPGKYGPLALNENLIRGLTHAAGQLAPSAMGLRPPSRMDGNLASLEANPAKTAQAIFDIAAAKFGPEGAMALASQAQMIYGKQGSKAEKLAFTKDLARMVPEVIQPSADGMTVVQGEFVFPEEQSLHLSEAVNGSSDLATEASVVGNGLFNKYTPIRREVPAEAISERNFTPMDFDAMSQAFDVTPPPKFSLNGAPPEVALQEDKLRALMGRPY